MSPDGKLLLTSIHDVGPRSEAQVDRLRDHLGQHVPVDKLAMLVVPDHWGEAPLRAGTPFAARLRGWAEAGGEMFVHGWYHRDTSEHESFAARMKAKHMTASEGEFLGLDEATAYRRMTEGRALIEDIIGKPVAGFIAPAWLYGPGAHAAMARAGFPLAEDHWRVWRPGVADQPLTTGPVLTWASRSRARIASSLFAARALPPLLRFKPVARIAVHPGDTGVPALLESISRALARMTRSHRPGRYAELLARQAASPPVQARSA
jgi:predicted deacetylase